VGKAHARGYLSSPDAELVALCDMNAERLAQAADEWKVSGRYTDYREMLRDAKPEMVSVCVPNALHAEVTIAALEAGAHVICEKPMASTIDEAQAMIAAAERAKRRLMMAYNYRYRPDSQWMRRMVSSGKLGQVHHVAVSWRRETGIPGWGWFGSKAMSGGGALIDLGVHVLDLALWMMDFPAVRTISAETRTLFGPQKRKTWGAGMDNPADFNVDDGGVAFLRLANEASMFVHVTWAEHQQPQEDAIRVEIQGTEGTAILHIRNYRNDDTLRYFTEIEGEPVTVTPSVRFGAPQGHEGMVRELVESVRYGRTPGTSGEQGLAAVVILDALYRSAAAGREVILSE
jgi:predicted dehydrogenase